MSLVSLKEYIAALNSGDMDTITENAWILKNIFDTYYYETDRNELATVLNRLIEICVHCKDRETAELLLDTIELGAGRNGTECVDFKPLIGMFEEEKYSDMLWQLVIILGFSLQPDYIEFLNSIETDDDFLKKEIADAVYELKYSNYNNL